MGVLEFGLKGGGSNRFSTEIKLVGQLRMDSWAKSIYSDPAHGEASMGAHSGWCRSVDPVPTFGAQATEGLLFL